MNTIRNICEVDLRLVAHDFAGLLDHPDNSDIAVEFPLSVAHCTGDVEIVEQNLLDAKNACAPGRKQQFIAFSDERAVGLSAIRLSAELPPGIDSSYPNVSGLICNPYRSKGLGGLALQELLKVADEQFGGTAWTKVKKPNDPSNRAVMSAGFVLIGEDADSNIYTYRSGRRLLGSSKIAN